MTVCVQRDLDEHAGSVNDLLFSLARCRVLTWAAATAGLMFGMLAFAEPAKADFRLCNNTGSRVGVAVGYKDAEGWITEGWWNISSRSCDTLLRGALVARYYYIYAIDYDRGGEWSGHAFMCSRDKEFTIRGTDNCLARGYDRTGYFEVDTQEQRSWTVQLTDTADSPVDRPLLPRSGPPPSRPPLGSPMSPPPGGPPPGMMPPPGGPPPPPPPEGLRR